MESTELLSQTKELINKINTLRKTEQGELIRVDVEIETGDYDLNLSHHYLSNQLRR